MFLRIYISCFVFVCVFRFVCVRGSVRFLCLCVFVFILIGRTMFSQNWVLFSYVSTSFSPTSGPLLLHRTPFLLTSGPCLLPLGSSFALPKPSFVCFVFPLATCKHDCAPRRHQYETWSQPVNAPVWVAHPCVLLSLNLQLTTLFVPCCSRVSVSFYIIMCD